MARRKVSSLSNKRFEKELKQAINNPSKNILAAMAWLDVEDMYFASQNIRAYRKKVLRGYIACIEKGRGPVCDGWLKKIKLINCSIKLCHTHILEAKAFLKDREEDFR